MNWRRYLLPAIGVVLVVATFAWFLPTVADYGEVWDVVQELSWPWLLGLVAVTVLNLATFAPPWQVALPGLRFVRALEMTQASAAVSTVVPGGSAAGAGVAWGMLRSWGFPRREITRAVALVGLWNQFLNLLYPVVALGLMTAVGEDTALLTTTAFVGLVILCVIVTGFVIGLASDRLARDVGDLAARVASRLLGKIGRGPVTWSGESFQRFRHSSRDLLRRRWHALTLVSLAGSLSVFLVLLVALRALDVPSSEVSLTEAFAAWALARLLGSIPITPGGIGVIEIGLTTALVGFGGNNAGVVAAVLVYRFLTVVPPLAFGLVAAGTWRRHRPAAAPVDPAGEPFIPSG